ncbi:MAG TPA: hypothetical protein VHO70_17530, partial [Chitinispirillaceae bacterium]|nr:hypothetical protein [Chitinispirillaceae bacterium]
MISARCSNLYPILEPWPAVLSNKEIAMRVWERGCGETQACGTGACASVVSGILNKL